MIQEGSVGAQVFSKSRKRSIADAKRPVYLIIYGNSIHKAKWVREFFDQQQGQLKLSSLPLYSPQLNFAEQVGGVMSNLVLRNN